MQELNVYVAGRPFSGCGMVAEIIHANWKGFKYIDMNYLVNTMYNDFITINQHTGQMRLAVRSAVILKNAEFLYRSIGIPEFIAAQKLWKWSSYLDNSMPPLAFKRAIWQTMNEFNPNWRTIFVRERLIENPSSRYVITHALSENEISFLEKPIIVWVESDDTQRYLHASKGSQGTLFSNILTREYEKFENYCKKKASFIVYNNDGIGRLEIQVNDLGESLGVEVDGITFNQLYKKKLKERARLYDCEETEFRRRKRKTKG